MGRHLAALLKSYRTPIGNRYTFGDQRSLHELANRMSEISRQNITAEVLSRAIAGRRPLTDEQIHAFANALQLDAYQKWELYYAAARDLCERKGLEIDLSTAPPVISVLARNVTRVDEAIAQGSLTLALHLLADLYTARAELEGQNVPPVPLVRIMAMTQMQREKLVAELAAATADDASWTGEFEIESLDYSEFDVSTLKLEKLSLSAVEDNLWHLFYQEGKSVDELAEQEGLTEATIYAVLDSIRERLLQSLATD